MKKCFTVVLLLFLILAIGLFHKQIVILLLDNFIFKNEIIVQGSNYYAFHNSYTFVQSTNDFVPKSKQDLKNIVYTYLDRGWNNFSFYCPDEYTTCLEDIKALAKDSETLSSINNFVHPFNSYEQLYVTLNNFGKVTIETKYLYSQEEQNTLNNKIDEILNEIIKENMTEKEKLKAIHDYIINHSVYDKERAEAIKIDKDINIQNPSHKAIGPLLNGVSLCSGYSDAMALFLDRLEIKNYKIASKDHVWNFVYVEDAWYHIDLTWDDPVVSTNENLLLDDFFLITTEELRKIDLEQHIFNEEIYIEAKYS